MSRNQTIEDIADEARHLIFQFQKIANFLEIRLAFEMGYTLDMFRRTALTHQIDAEVGRRMLEASIFAHATATARLPASFDRDVVNNGMRAVGGLIVAWTESTVERSAREPATYQDMRDHLRILCNSLHNVDLQDRIADRRAGRIRQAVSKLQRIAG